MNEAVRLSYQDQRKIHWLEVLAGDVLLAVWAMINGPQATLDAFRDYHIGIKGPLTTPVGGGIRSLNVLLNSL